MSKYKCPYCGKEYKSLPVLKYHLRTKHSDEEFKPIPQPKNKEEEVKQLSKELDDIDFTKPVQVKKNRRYESKKRKKERLLMALENSLGVITTACKAADLSRDTYYKYINEDPEFEAQVNQIKEMAVDFVESKLYQHIQGGDVTSTIFYLKCKAKNRGYVEKMEVENTHKIEQILIEPYKKLDEHKTTDSSKKD